MTLLTQPALLHTSLDEWHILPFSGLCPFSGNPQKGSVLYVLYRPVSCYLEVYSLRAYVNSYIGGRGAVRDMEGAIQSMASDFAQTLDVPVIVGAWIVLQRGDAMTLFCEARP